MTKPTQQDLEEWGSWLAGCSEEEGITQEDIHAWMKNRIASRRKVRPFLPPKGPLFRHVTDVQIGPMDARPTNACLFNRLWKNRPDEFEKWLLPTQPFTRDCRVIVLETRWPATYQEWAAALLQLRSYTPEAELERLLLVRRYTLSLSQGQKLVERADNWTTSGLMLGEPGNFFLTPNAVGGISVVNIRCDAQHWEPYLKGFSSEHPRVAGCRLLAANLDDVTLHDITKVVPDDSTS
jgi:hypothetical protein